MDRPTACAMADSHKQISSNNNKIARINKLGGVWVAIDPCPQHEALHSPNQSYILPSTSVHFLLFCEGYSILCNQNMPSKYLLCTRAICTVMCLFFLSCAPWTKLKSLLCSLLSNSTSWLQNPDKVICILPAWFCMGKGNICAYQKQEWQRIGGQSHQGNG